MCQNPAVPCSKGLFESDLVRSLRHGDQHDVHDADSADQKSNAGDPNQQAVGTVGQFLLIASFLQKVLRLIGDRIFSRAAPADGFFHDLLDLPAHFTHPFRGHRSHNAVLRLIIIVQDRPVRVGNQDQSELLPGVRFVVLQRLDHRLEIVRLFDQAHHNKGLSHKFHRPTDRVFPGKQKLCCLFIQQCHFAESLIIRFHEGPPLIDNVSNRRQVVGIHPEKASSRKRIDACRNFRRVLPLKVEGCVCHAAQFPDLFDLRIRDGNHIARHSRVHPIFRFSLPQRDRHVIISCADQILHDLLVCPLNGGDDGNDRCDSDDHAQHGQKGTQLMRPDSFQRKPDIFAHIRTPHVCSRISRLA